MSSTSLEPTSPAQAPDDLLDDTVCDECRRRKECPTVDDEMLSLRRIRIATNDSYTEAALENKFRGYSRGVILIEEIMKSIHDSISVFRRVTMDDVNAIDVIRTSLTNEMLGKCSL